MLGLPDVMGLSVSHELSDAQAVIKVAISSFELLVGSLESDTSSFSVMQRDSLDSLSASA